MSRLSLRLVPVLVLALGMSVPAFGLNVVDTSSNVNCLYVTTSPCTTPVTDYVSYFNVSGGSGQAFLQSRIFQGQPGSAAAGKWRYLYRVNMTNVGALTYFPYVDQVAISSVGTVWSWDYNFDFNYTDQVFNITVGGIGTKAVTSSFVFWGWTYFDWSNPVYSGSYPGGGESSYFFGFTSDKAPVIRNISVHTDSGWVTVTGYAPTP